MPTRKTALLLAALAILGGRGLSRDTLCELLWPDRSAGQARGSLRQALAAIRRLVADAGGIRLEGDTDVLHLATDARNVDARLFDRALDSADVIRLAEAADLYRGDLLAGVAITEPLDQWFAVHQQAYRRKALSLCERLSATAEGASACEGLAQRLLATDPAAEEAHRALIRLYQQQGRTNAALRQYELCKEALRRELGAVPEPQTSELVAAAPTAERTPTEARPSPVPTSGQPAAGIVPPRDADQPSVIVMPFDNLSGEADEYFVDGVVEEITSALSRVKDFFVIARQSAYAYRGRLVDVREIGRELGVRYAVEGTVRRGGDRLRISVQLVEAETRTQLWSERYEGATTDVFDLQDKIAAQVAGAIHPAVRHAEITLSKRRPPSSLRAYDFVMRAYPRIWSQDPDDNRQAMALLRQAAAADPAYGRAHALLAWCHSQEVVYLWSSDPDGDRRRALQLAEVALGLIDDDPTSLTAVGAALSQCGEDQGAAGAQIARALAIDPNHSWAWTRYGWVALFCGDAALARERFERALALSPFDPLAFNIKNGIATALALEGDYAAAAGMTRQVLAEHPSATWIYRQLASFSALAGDRRAAQSAVQKLLSAYPNASIATMLAQHPMRQLPRFFERLVEGWRLAGLPER